AGTPARLAQRAGQGTRVLRASEPEGSRARRAHSRTAVSSHTGRKPRTLFREGPLVPETNGPRKLGTGASRLIRGIEWDFAGARAFRCGNTFRDSRSHEKVVVPS